MVLNLVPQTLTTAWAYIANLKLTESHGRIKIKTLLPRSNNVLWTLDGCIQISKRCLLQVEIILKVVLIEIAFGDGFGVHLEARAHGVLDLVVHYGGVGGVYEFLAWTAHSLILLISSFEVGHAGAYGR